MSIKGFIPKIKDFVANGDLESALSTLGEMLDSNNITVYNQSYLLLNFQFSRLNKKQLTLSHKDFELALTKIAAGILEICDQIISRYKF